MYEGMNVVFSVGLSLFMGYCLSYFYGNFLECRLKIRGMKNPAHLSVNLGFQL